MNVIEKLRVMLPHWIEHNHGHAQEFARWADQLGETEGELAGQLRQAVKSLEEAQHALEEALALTGGAPSEEEACKGSDHGHHHHHHH